MLDDENSLAFEELRSREACQSCQTFLGMAVGRVEKTDVKSFAGAFELRQSAKDGDGPNLPIEGGGKRKGVFTNQGGGAAVGLDKDHAPGAPAACLQPHRARARVAVKKRALVHPTSQDVEQRFSQAIARGPEIKPPQGPKPSPAEFASNNTHVQELA